jgi:hypothetical protein
VHVVLVSVYASPNPHTPTTQPNKQPTSQTNNTHTQLGADTYRCEMAPIAFFSATIVPVIDVVSLGGRMDG